jgi:hypothetical protein
MKQTIKDVLDFEDKINNPDYFKNCKLAEHKKGVFGDKNTKKFEQRNKKI